MTSLSISTTRKKSKRKSPFKPLNLKKKISRLKKKLKRRPRRLREQFGNGKELTLIRLFGLEKRTISMMKTT